MLLKNKMLILKVFFSLFWLRLAAHLLCIQLHILFVSGLAFLFFMTPMAEKMNPWMVWGSPPVPPLKPMYGH